MKRILTIAAASLLCIAAGAQSKFAHVNFVELVQLMPEADEARAAIAASSQEAQETFSAMVKEYEDKYSVYQQKSASWTPAIRETKEKELTEIVQRINDFDKNIQAELQQQQQTLMAPIQQKAINTVNQLAKEGGYIYVFDKTSILYIDESQSTDLTPAARKALGIKDGRTLESLQQELAAQAALQ